MAAMLIRTCLAAAATTLLSSIVPIPAAHGQPGVNWDAVAACESGGNWSINTGNGYAGGLQWAPGTWAANKPPGAPAQASQASREQQIEAANRLYAKAGLAPWPVCGARG